MSSVGERVEVLESEIAVRLGDGERALGFKLPAPIVFAAPLRLPEGRDELAVVTRADAEDRRTWSLTTFRFEGARLSRSLDAVPLYVLTSANARWIGVELRDYMGADRIMWSTDYPHGGHEWPNTRNQFDRLFRNVPEDDIQKIVHDNAVTFFSLDI